MRGESSGEDKARFIVLIGEDAESKSRKIITKSNKPFFRVTVVSYHAFLAGLKFKFFDNQIVQMKYADFQIDIQQSLSWRLVICSCVLGEYFERHALLHCVSKLLTGSTYNGINIVFNLPFGDIERIGCIS